MRIIILLVLLAVSSTTIIAQSWNLVDETPSTIRDQRDIIPARYIVAEVDDAQIKELLWTAPMESAERGRSGLAVSLMLADGSIDEFSVFEYAMMEPALASRYTDIKTYHGRSTSNPLRRVRIDYTVHGLRAVITDPHQQTYIDHYQRNDKTLKVIYFRNDYVTNEDWTCTFEDQKTSKGRQSVEASDRFAGDCVFRSYRLSVTATGEYSNFHGADMESESALVLSAITTTVNRVNDVFEQDITSRFVLIDNTDDIFYYDQATDPFDGSNASSMINQNQTNTDNVIGSANYDLGHIFSTGGSGLAGLGVICSNGNKARGVTGIGTPAGDPFDIDYVAHEIGHQLGAGHTQNNSCNRSTPSAMEPGSASTIMGYAGICAPNVQNNSDAYFHAISIQQMSTEITNNSCHGVIALNNVKPVVNAVNDYSIPHSTPFVLEVVATDADGDTLSYNWEQMDNQTGPTMPPAGTNAVGPMFRSRFATAEPTRYFPPLDNVINGTSDQWEVLPTVGRDMNFRVTVRDHYERPGCTEETDMTVSVIGDAGPFAITSIDQTPWLETQNVTIQWDVAGTDQAPISCGTVDIYLSTDGGLTFPQVMATGETNDGSASVSVPLGTTSTARVMIKCSDNVFYNVNDQNFEIQVGAPAFSLSATPDAGVHCEDDAVTFTLEAQSILGYTDPINLSLSGLPAGASGVIGTNPLTPGSSTSVTISNLQGQIGTFPVLVDGVSGTITDDVTYNMSVISPASAPALAEPADMTVGTTATPILKWNATPGSSAYEYEVSTIAAGGNIVASGSINETEVSLTTLSLSTTHYWRVRAVTPCGTTDWSTEWTFETGQCLTFAAGDLPINISSQGTPTIVSSLDVTSSGTVIDINVVDLTGTHTWVSDLNFTLIAPDATEQEFWADPCDREDDYNINFDDEAPNNSWPCPPTDGGTYIPDNSLSVFDGLEIEGQWQLQVFDDANQDGGTLDSWGLEICYTVNCDLTVDQLNYDTTLGSLEAALDCAVAGDTIYLDSAIANGTISLQNQSITIAKDLVIIANRADNIRIVGEGDGSTLTIAAGVEVALIGFDLENIDGDGPLVANAGQLTLEDMNFTYAQGTIPVDNQIGAELSIKGNCNIYED